MDLMFADGAEWVELRGTARFLVGRGTGADIQILDASVSRRHAELDLREGRLLVRDLGSVNGTYVNGAAVPADGAMHLVPGDVVTFGTVAFTLRASDLPRAAPPTNPATRPATGH